MQKKNYFLVGLISVVLLSSIVTLILWKKSFFKKIQSYEIIGEFESINGLLENAVVKYRGYPVGRVTGIFPNTKNIEVYFFVDSKFKIPFGSTVKIIFDGLVGEKYMEIIPNKREKNMLVDGSRITGFSSSDCLILLMLEHKTLRNFS